MDVEWAPEGGFYQIHRSQDIIGRYAPDFHIGPSIEFYDAALVPTVGMLAHNIDRYSLQVEAIAASAVVDFIATDAHILLLSSSLENFANVAGYEVAFGGDYNDTIFTLSSGPIIVDGGIGSDSITGSVAADRLAGGSGADQLAGLGGGDLLFGGSGGDRYSIGVYEGADVISDLGGSGVDIVAVSTGSIFGAIDYNWFVRDGNDLLVQAYATNGSLALEVRIENMGSASGRIERFDLLAGDGSAITQSWDLAALWAGLAQPDPPPEPSISIPPESSAFTSGDDTVIGGSGDDDLTTRGRGNDSVDLAGGDDLLIIDYSWTDASVSAAPYFTGYRYGVAGIGDSYAYNIERVYVTGGSAADYLLGLAGHDALVGGGGNDTLDGQAGNDSLLGGAGADFLFGGSGVDWLDGGSGNDYAAIQLGNEAGSVTLSTQVAASAAGFTLVDGTHVRNVERVSLTTGSGDDSIWITTGGDHSFATGEGDDELHFSSLGALASYWNAGQGGDDHLIADMSAATERVEAYYFASASAFAVRVASVDAFNGNYVDRVTVVGGSGNDYMVGHDGDDDFTGNGGNDDLQGNDGDDRLDGGAGADFLFGGSGVDWLDGGSGNDRLEAGAGDDALNGGEGDDLLSGGLGMDRLVGGGGADTFIFSAVPDSRAYALRSDGKKFMPDTVADFIPGEDKIDLSAIDAVAGGPNDAFTFIGTAAFTSQAGQLRFELVNGHAQIFADVDGDGVADLSITVLAPTLQSTDFLL
ncbi:MAG TPA: calcium-binding protein [Aestuariivirgaceae bacterium]|nr:calcium-binding protein [Aestuariivirgaceae bacterium]